MDDIIFGLLELVVEGVGCAIDYSHNDYMPVKTPIDTSRLSQEKEKRTLESYIKEATNILSNALDHYKETNNVEKLREEIVRASNSLTEIDNIVKHKKIVLKSRYSKGIIDYYEYDNEIKKLEKPIKPVESLILKIKSILYGTEMPKEEVKESKEEVTEIKEPEVKLTNEAKDSLSMKLYCRKDAVMALVNHLTNGTIDYDFFCKKLVDLLDTKK